MWCSSVKINVSIINEIILVKVQNPIKKKSCELFCRCNQGDASFRVSLRKHIIPTALYGSDLFWWILFLSRLLSVHVRVLLEQRWLKILLVIQHPPLSNRKNSKGANNTDKYLWLLQSHLTLEHTADMSLSHWRQNPDVGGVFIQCKKGEGQITRQLPSPLVLQVTLNQQRLKSSRSLPLTD